jgi:hypothetical protein
MVLTRKQEIMEQFKKGGFNAELHDLKDFEDDYGVKYGLKDGENEEDEDEGDEEDEEDGTEDGGEYEDTDESEG